MIDNLTTNRLASIFWFKNAIIFSVCIATVMAFAIQLIAIIAIVPVFVVTIVLSSPVYVIYLFYFNYNKQKTGYPVYSIIQFAGINLVITILYALGMGLLLSIFLHESFINILLISSATIFASFLITIAFNYSVLQQHCYINHLHKNKNKITMEDQSYQPYAYTKPATQNNKTLIKGLITAGLILALLIPAFFLQNLVKEREERQQIVVAEVSNKWAAPQTITGPYLYITYKKPEVRDGKIISTMQSFYVLPETLKTTASIEPQELSRSIYKVLLYKSAINISGNIMFRLPEGDITKIENLNVSLCMGLSDFKGIEESVHVKLNGVDHELSPGLPTNEIDTIGLSIPVALTLADLGKSVEFNTALKIKGSKQLHFIPLSGNSSFTVTSTWAAPSFDGNAVPGTREVTNKGFNATWNFNKANLPFTTCFVQSNFNKNSIAFGVSLVQPADQYAKTMRSVKYAILFIGLTFALFFIIELLQKRPVHPVQYVLVGIALIIFFALLLSISEIILFDYAYAIAATATILLITMYAKGHFKKTKIALVFAGVLAGLYGFIYILISLQDTALLIGSIGLFIVLALIMYASRKINWYGTTEEPTV